MTLSVSALRLKGVKYCTLLPKANNSAVVKPAAAEPKLWSCVLDN